MATEVKLQALKENVEVVEVNAVKVSVGDTVTAGQALMEVQADKAALEVPAPSAGVISQILVKTGDSVKIGQSIFVIDANGSPSAAAPAAKPASAPTAAAKPSAPVPVAASKPAVTPAVAQTIALATHQDDKITPASPVVRRMARELGVELSMVPGTGRHGRISEEDIRAFVQNRGAGATGGGTGISVPALPRFEDIGPVEKQPMSAIRKATARQMNLSWSIVPHVTQNDLVDITDFENFRRSESKGPKFTITAFALKAAAVLLQEFPVFNSSVDMQNNSIIYKKYYNIGVAVDTENGLLVPVIRDVDKKKHRGTGGGIDIHRGACSSAEAGFEGPFRWHIHHHQSGWHWRNRIYPDRQLSGSCHSWHF